MLPFFSSHFEQSQSEAVKHRGVLGSLLHPAQPRRTLLPLSQSIDFDCAGKESDQFSQISRPGGVR